MSAYGQNDRGTIAIDSRDGVYHVALPSRAAVPTVIDLREDVWSPARFGALAREAFGEPVRTTSVAPSGDLTVYRQLLNLGAGPLVTTSATVSRALAADMRSPQAHEAAALTLGAFALREAAGRFADTRWAMNRMTAHLAVAAALRGDGEPSNDGRLAVIVLSTLTNQQTRALAGLDALDATAAATDDDALAAWSRAIRTRITEDVRIISAPAAASLLEKREWFRASRAAGAQRSGLAMLDEIAAPYNADALRMIEASTAGVEDRQAIEDAMQKERAEAAEVFERINARAIGDEWPSVLNTRATRLIGPSGPQVLPWGAWAEFAQRHLALFIGSDDAFYRHTIGSEHVADTEKHRLKAALGSLRIFPIATIFWTKGVAGGDADLGLINEAISGALAAPELVAPAPWAFLATGAHYETVRRGMPAPGTWFAATSTRFAYEASRRIKEGASTVTPDAMLALSREMPYNDALASQYLRAKYGEHPPAAEVIRAYGPKLEYSVRALRSARAFAQEESADQLRIAALACAANTAECIEYGRELATANREADAAASYERAFADPALDAVALSNSSSWLVSYYYRHGRTAAALQLAERAASTGAMRGSVTAAYLYERLGRSTDAEATYRAAATNYDDWPQLIGFYYRAVNIRHQTEFEQQWKISLARIFPDGLVSMTASNAQPEHGVVVTKDSVRSRKAGLQAGDIIVGLEGWAVANLQQYTTINAFFERDEVRLAAWRGRLFTVSATAPNRLFGTELRSYPIAGWREK
jgi:hypothetical protein